MNTLDGVTKASQTVLYVLQNVTILMKSRRRFPFCFLAVILSSQWKCEWNQASSDVVHTIALRKLMFWLWHPRVMEKIHAELISLRGNSKSHPRRWRLADGHFIDPQRMQVLNTACAMLMWLWRGKRILLSSLTSALVNCCTLSLHEQPKVKKQTTQNSCPSGQETVMTCHIAKFMLHVFSSKHEGDTVKECACLMH